MYLRPYTRTCSVSCAALAYGYAHHMPAAFSRKKSVQYPRKKWVQYSRKV